MKRVIAIIAAFLIGFRGGSLNVGAADGQGERMPKATPSNLEKQAEAGEKEPVRGEESEIANLQIPQRLAVVLDPWEMDGKGQIYSEEYVIQNMGKMPGILTLSFACKPGESGNTFIKTESGGLHEDENKSLYIKIIFGNGEELCLSEEGAEYQTELGAGEELVICFDGELNENASEPWENGDVVIEGIYSWDEAETFSAGENPQEEDFVLPDGDTKEQEENLVVNGDQLPNEVTEVEEIQEKNKEDDNSGEATAEEKETDN